MTDIQNIIPLLCCPRTKLPLRELSSDEQNNVLELAKGQKLFDRSGLKIDAFDKALITIDGKSLYLIKQGVPFLTYEMGITLRG